MATLGVNFVKTWPHNSKQYHRLVFLLAFSLLFLSLSSYFLPVFSTTKTTTQSESGRKEFLKEYEEHEEVSTSTSSSTLSTPIKEKVADYRWPNRQLNVLVDERTVNLTETQILNALLDQLEHKTCIAVKRFSSSNVNPFDNRRHFLPGTDESGKNFVYIFKTKLPMQRSKTAIGLSTFGCARQGRQSMILSDLAFIAPDLVLGYHLLRTLGVPNLKKPDTQVSKRIDEMFPTNQKINHHLERPESPYFAYATIASALAARSSSAGAPDPVLATNGQAILSLSATRLASVEPVEYLTKEDLGKIKELYNCTDFVNKLSLKPLNELVVKNESSAQFYNDDLQQSDDSHKEEKLTTSIPEPRLLNISNDQKLKDTAKAIANSILSEENGDTGETNTCKLNSSVPKDCSRDRSAKSVDVVMKPMLLKLDSFNAHDPLMKQANQMKLSLMNGNETRIYQKQLLKAPADLSKNKSAQPKSDAKQQQQQGTASAAIENSSASTRTSTNEMQISFEQTSGKELAQVLKLCSCTCQTMMPVPSTPPVPTPLPSIPPQPTETSRLETDEPVQPTTEPIFPLTEPTWIIETESGTSEPPPKPTTTTSEPVTTLATTSSSKQPVISTEEPTLPPVTVTDYPTSTSEIETIETEESTSVTLRPSTSSQGKATKTEQPTTTDTSTLRPATTTAAATGSSYCEQVEWVKPNKSVYSSAKIVWDVDRANQNYFLCQNQINGELVPGKTHGFSCKVSSEGKAYEMHTFNVLTKPEKVNLAWVQRDSKSFGKTNLPVIGGYSRKNSFDNQDPYVVSRCLVRDENNDVITLIGYVNSQGAGWFPFDDIQIECAQYDVLACVI